MSDTLSIPTTFILLTVRLYHSDVEKRASKVESCDHPKRVVFKKKCMKFCYQSKRIGDSEDLNESTSIVNL